MNEAISKSLHIKELWVPRIAGGCSPEAHSSRLATVDPATEEIIAEVVVATHSDVDRAVQSARALIASGTIRTMTLQQRSEALHNIAIKLRDQVEWLAWLLVIDAGKAVSVAKKEVLGAARLFEYNAALCEGTEGRYLPIDQEHAEWAIYEPVGVVAHFVPWNYPLGMAARSLAPALAAGNANVVMAPELAPLACLALVDIIDEAGFPPGSISVLTGRGQIIGQALAKHPRLDLIVFTGSLETGRQVMAAAAQNITPVILELGGKSAGIVCSDANIDAVLDSVKDGLFRHSGQVCDAMSRLIVLPELYDTVREKLFELTSSLSIGPGADDNTIVPLISRNQCCAVANALDRACKDGGRIHLGAKGDTRGYYHSAAVLFDTDPKAWVNQTEIFGPVISILRAKDINDAITIANDSCYGLAAGIFTTNINLALTCAGRLDAGQVHINEWGQGGFNTPFGGVKQSGIGREKGRDGFLNYVRIKSVGLKLARCLV